MISLNSREEELKILEVSGLARLNRKFIMIKELNWSGIVEISEEGFIYEDLDEETFILWDLVKAKVFKTKEDFEKAFKDFI